MKIDYPKLKQRIRLGDLLERIGWAATEGRGDQLRGPCPLPVCCSRRCSDGRTAESRAFSIHTTKNVYRCFDCRSVGNVVDFWRAYRNTTLYAAAIELYHLLETSNHTSLANQPPTPQHSSNHPAKLADS